MIHSPLTIRSVTARAVVVPLARPVRTAMGSIPEAPLVLVDLTTEEGVTGCAYLFAYTPLALAPLARLVGDLGATLVGQPVAPVARQADLSRRLRLLGWQGLAGMAVSGLDMAMWDALARAFVQPLAVLLGGAVRPLKAYDSYGLVDPRADEAALRQSVEAGFAGVKIKGGDGDLARDVANVAAVRSIIGPHVALMIDFNQALDPVEAIRRGRALERFDLTWIEEPVAAEDLAGHARVRAGIGVPVQTGENWWFPADMAKAVAAQASDLVMPDVMKIGGVTGWQRAAALAHAASLPLSSHLFIEASAHLLAVTPTADWLEHLDVASAILTEPLPVVNGQVTARGTGLGLAWDEKAIARYAFC